MQDRQDQLSNLRFWQNGAIFLAACVILVTRRPDALFHAQFFAEDGKVWFADNYNLGWWQALLQPHTGYFQTLPRLGAAISLLVPFAIAPLVLNLIAFVVQALPVNLLLSSRSAGWGSLGSRALFAFIYLALPNSAEISFGITFSQWLLALSAFLLLVATTPRSVAGRLFDLSILLLSGLSGPFCIFLTPIAMFLALNRRERWRWVPAGVLTVSSLVQVLGLLVLNPSIRPHYDLGANPASFARVLAGQVYLGALIGSNGLAYYPSPRLSLFLYCVAIGGTALVVVCSVKSALEIRLFLLFSAVLMAVSLISPVIRAREGVTVWDLMAGASGIHYWFFPTLAFAWSLLWCFKSRITVLKIVSAYLCFFMCLGVIRDWRQPAFQDMHFAEYAKSFEAAPAETTVTIPENPDGWTMVLLKHTSKR
jgi:hypothetical protein